MASNQKKMIEILPTEIIECIIAPHLSSFGDLHNFSYAMGSILKLIPRSENCVWHPKIQNEETLSKILAIKKFDVLKNNIEPIISVRSDHQKYLKPFVRVQMLELFGNSIQIASLEQDIHKVGEILLRSCTIGENLKLLVEHVPIIHINSNTVQLLDKNTDSWPKGKRPFVLENKNRFEWLYPFVSKIESISWSPDDDDRIPEHIEVKNLSITNQHGLEIVELPCKADVVLFAQCNVWFSEPQTFNTVEIMSGGFVNFVAGAVIDHLIINYGTMPDNVKCRKITASRMSGGFSKVPNLLEFVWQGPDDIIVLDSPPLITVEEGLVQLTHGTYPDYIQIEPNGFVITDRQIPTNRPEKMVIIDTPEKKRNFLLLVEKWSTPWSESIPFDLESTFQEWSNQSSE